MSNTSKSSAHAVGEHTTAHTTGRTDEHAYAVETKPSFKTTELIVFAVVALGIIIASAVIGDGQGGGADHFSAYRAAQLITFLSIGYMIARGLAKAGSRQPRD